MSSQPPLTRLEPLIFEQGAPGRHSLSFPPLDVPDRPLEALLPPAAIRTAPPVLPEVSELEVVRHYTRLSRENYGVDVGFYPLGSCTMKYNPKVNEDVARLPGFALLHPLTPPEQAQGALALIYELEQCLKAIGGVARVSLQPAAGAQGELVGLLMVRAYHEHRGHEHRGQPRTTVVVPDTAHGTNPASAALAGLKVRVVRSSKAGLVDLEDLRRVVDRDTAALMLTNPNTLGLFERDILEISRIVHEAGGLMYMDGANLNALVGLCRPGEMGFDVVHFNLHKTFSTPHGGGGPGAGAVGVRADLAPFLPAPTIEKVGDRYVLDENRPRSIGRVHPFYGNFGILVRAYAYIRRLGAEGLRGVSRGAILNANYIRKRLEGAYTIPYNRACMHEFVLSCKRFTPNGVHAWDVAKRLMDYGIYSPTVNFPQLVEECLMIEAPETEALETLDEFCEAMLAIAREAEQTPAIVKTAPRTRRPGRLDEVKAARRPILRWSRKRP